MGNLTVPPAGGGAVPGAWDEYWRLSRETSALKGGGPLDEVLARFWRRVLGRPLATGARLLDIASGNGAVTAAAVGAGSGSEGAMGLFGIDRAEAAVRAYKARFPTATGVAGDARRLPFADRCFDLVASQFGIEYAGVAAFGEAARVTAPGGLLAAVVHRTGGAIHRECAGNAAAMARVAASGILPAAREVFRRGAAASRGQGSRAAFRDADARLAAAVRQVEGVLTEFGAQVAGGTVQRLYGDLAHMYGRLAAYDPADVAAWADLMAREIEAYSGRMDAALEAAMDEERLARAAAQCEAGGLSVLAREELRAGPDGGEPAAWVLVCERS
ncbi:MAG: class I SAM-dependent methyltransferase [Lysobacter sp.]|nr:class I SAM-dependent methyltransferase [Lysobacter sp.]